MWAHFVDDRARVGKPVRVRPAARVVWEVPSDHDGDRLALAWLQRDRVCENGRVMRPVKAVRALADRVAHLQHRLRERAVVAVRVAAPSNDVLAAVVQYSKAVRTQYLDISFCGPYQLPVGFWVDPARVPLDGLLERGDLILKEGDELLPHLASPSEVCA